MLHLGLKDVFLIEQSREQAGGGPRLYPPPSLKMGRKRDTRVCKVRVAQCVCIALTGSKSQTSRKQTPFSVLGCDAPSEPGAFGVYVGLRALSASGDGACNLMSEARLVSHRMCSLTIECVLLLWNVFSCMHVPP